MEVQFSCAVLVFAGCEVQYLIFAMGKTVLQFVIISMHFGSSGVVTEFIGLFSLVGRCQ